MDASELTKLAMDASKATSIRDFAKKAGVSHVAVIAWLDGTRTPTFEQAAALAEMAGLPAVPTAAKVRLESPEGVKHRALLRRLATAAALAFVAIGISPPGLTKELVQNQSPSDISAAHSVHYAKLNTGRIRRTLARLTNWLTSWTFPTAWSARHDAIAMA